MNERGVEIKVGVLVTVCLGLLVAFIVILGDFSMADGGTLYLDVETSADLKRGAPVKIAGTPAGKVTEVRYEGGRLDEKVGRRVWVRARLNIDTDKLATLRRDARFYITTLGILGEKYVEVAPGSTEAPLLKPGDVVEGEPPLRLEIMAANASRVLRTLDRVLTENEKEIGGIIRNANQTVTTAREMMKRIDGLIVRTEPEVKRVVDSVVRTTEKGETLLTSANTAIGDGTSIRRTIDNTERLTRTARDQLPSLVSDARRALRRAESALRTGDETISEAKSLVIDALKKANRAMSSVDGLLADAKVLTQRLKDGKGTIGALLSDQEMYDDIREMMKDLKRHPWKFLWKE